MNQNEKLASLARNQKVATLARTLEREIAVDFIDEIRRLRQFVELADDLTPFRDPLVRDDLETVMAIVTEGEMP